MKKFLFKIRLLSIQLSASSQYWNIGMILLHKVFHANICAYIGICILLSLYTWTEHVQQLDILHWGFAVCKCTAGQPRTMTGLDRPCWRPWDGLGPELLGRVWAGLCSLVFLHSLPLVPQVITRERNSSPLAWSVEDWPFKATSCFQVTDWFLVSAPERLQTA